MSAPALLLLTALFLFADTAPARTPTTDAVKRSAAHAAHAASSVAAKARKLVQRGKVSWYGPGFAGRKTASGERFDPRALTMAHRSLPLGTIVEVTNDANGKQVRVRVNDRGPYHEGRVADLSRAASLRLGFAEQGVTDATLRVVALPADAGDRVASDSTGRPDDRPG